ncbi:MAG: HAD family phosphatase [Planctomycetaceae bacterium]|nr:HAD family phosphatase [Planctomycetaceae bacterium]
MSQITAVVFDLDGLMFNTEEIFNETGTELLRRRGITDSQPVIARMMGLRAEEAFREMIDMCGFSETIEEMQIESDEYFHSILHDKIAPMPGLFELLDLIEQNDLPKAVATSSGRSYLEEVLGKYDLLHRFSHLLTSSDVTRGKPHPEIYLKAAELLAVKAENILVLEDSGNGTKAAAAAGTHIVSVPHRFSCNHDFSKAKHIADSLLDPYILKLVQQANK